MYRLAWLAFLFLSVLPPTASAQMKGDPDAVTAARRIVENMGGTERWSRAKWIYVEEQAFFAGQVAPARMEFWRRTDAPAEWGRRQSPAGNRLHAWTAESGWRIREGAISDLDRARLQSVHGWWPGEIYVMYARFARNDPGLRLTALSEPRGGVRTFTVLDDATGAHLGDFHVNAAGELVAWQHSFGTDSVHYVYGPLKNLGELRVPDWGALQDGSFRFYYTKFALRESDPPVSLVKPREIPADMR
jgi:hypothetical protein